MFGFIGKALGAVAKVAGVGSVADAVSTIKNAIAGNDKLQAEIRKIELEEQKLMLEEAKTIHELYQAEIKSEDKFISRARPAMLWLVFSILSMLFVVIPATNTAAMYWGWEQVTLVIPVLPDSVALLMGTIFSVYTGARSWDKKKNGGR